jgi:uncharacterized membrane protein
MREAEMAGDRAAVELGPKWDARYDARERRWICFKPGFMGFNAPVPDIVKPLSLADACRTQHKTSAVHFHDSDGRRASCGPAETTAAAPSGSPPQNVTPELAPPHAAAPQATPPPSEEATQTILQMCNVTNRPDVDAAYVYWDSETPGRRPGWTSVGWYALPPGQCMAHAIIGNSTDRTYLGYVYVFATNRSSQWGGNDGAFCVNDAENFALTDSDKMACERKPYKRFGMTRFHIKPGFNRWDFR